MQNQRIDLISSIKTLEAEIHNYNINNQQWFAIKNIILQLFQKIKPRINSLEVTNTNLSKDCKSIESYIVLIIFFIRNSEINNVLNVTGIDTAMKNHLIKLTETISLYAKKDLKTD